MPQLPPPLMGIQKTDPALFEEISRLYDLAMSPGELDAKTKVLMVMALDAFHGAAGGVKTLAKAARAMGATEGQIAETLRLAYSTAGMGTLFTSRAAYEE